MEEVQDLLLKDRQRVDVPLDFLRELVGLGRLQFLVSETEDPDRIALNREVAEVHLLFRIEAVEGSD